MGLAMEIEKRILLTRGDGRVKEKKEMGLISEKKKPGTSLRDKATLIYIHLVFA
ncbi:Leucine-rich repeat-containing protein 37A2 [Sesbania bispinosa]|nr:Leucine-rich repeat-containing protein 37A2 [Sesbania bispinosa]